MAWTPAEITTELWIDAADEATITKDGANKVSEWADKSGNDRHLTQSALNNRPSFHNSGDNFVFFDGKFMAANNTIGAFDFLHRGKGDVFAVLEFGGSNTASYLFATGNLSSSKTGAVGGREDRHKSVVEYALDSASIMVNSGDAGGNVVSARHFKSGGNSSGFPGYYSIGKDFKGLILDNERLLVGYHYNLVSENISDRVKASVFDGCKRGENTETGPINSGQASFDFHVGGIVGQPGGGTIKLREMVVVKDGVSGVDLRRLNGYLAHKWGLDDRLPDYHPYKLKAPGQGVTQTSKVSGVVQVNATPAGRAVRAFGYNPTAHDLDSEPVNLSKSLGHSVSDPETGEYTIDLLDGYGGDVFVVAFDEYGLPFSSGLVLSVGQRVHPTTPNGYIYECDGAGTLPTDEPVWSIDTETSQLHGTASLIARPFYRPVVHGPIVPEVIVEDPAP